MLYFLHFTTFRDQTLKWTFPVITSQLHGSEAEGPKQTRIGIRLGPSASLQCSCDVITGKVYFINFKMLFLAVVMDFVLLAYI